jgi:hypothetical protein
MSALKLSKAPIGLTVALALGGALALSMSCASTAPSDNTGGSGGNEGGGSGGGGDGGSTGFTCTKSDTNVCFFEGAATGAMNGWGWGSLGALDTLTDPTCDTDKHEIHNRDTSGPCTTTTNWNTKDALCITGTIPPLPKEPFQSDYDNNWGLQIGVNTSEPPGTTLGKDYTSITLTFSGEPSSGNRAELHVKGDAAGTTYCADAKSGKEIKFADFNKACWDGANADPKKALKAEMIPNIDKVGIQVSSVSEKEIQVKNLCLMGIQFKL